MPLLIKSALWLGLFLLAIGAILFFLKRGKRLSVGQELSFGDLTNCVVVLFPAFSLAFAIASYQEAAKSSEQQQQTLNVVRISSESGGRYRKRRESAGRQIC